MNVLGGLLGGAIEPLADAAGDYGKAREETKQWKDRAAAIIQVAAASWRPWLARLLGYSILLHVVGSFGLMIAMAYGNVAEKPWDLTATWALWIAYGKDLFSLTVTLLGLYIGSRGAEKVAPMIGGKAGSALGAAAGWVTGRNRVEVEREPLQERSGGIEKLDGVTVPVRAQTIIREPFDMSRFRDELLRDEGVRYESYKDSLGFLTAGVGHKILISDGIDSVGQKVSKEQVAKWFKADMKTAMRDARTLFEHFDDLPMDARLVLGGMSFQLGYHNLSKFVGMRAAIDRLDWQGAADEARDSLVWREQARKRWERYAMRFEALADKAQFA